MVLQDKVAVVTGCATEIGQAIARALVLEGGWVAIADRDQSVADEVARTLDPSGRRTMGIAIDVADELQLASAFAMVIQAFGGLDILVNNSDARTSVPVDIAFLDWKRTLASELDGAFLIARAALDHMYKQKNGCIIFVGPGFAEQAAIGDAAQITVWHGLVGLAKAISAVSVQQGIRANAICPGGASWSGSDTHPCAHSGPLKAPDERSPTLQVPDATGAADDVAEVVLFLSAFGSNALTGQTIFLSY